MIATREGRLGVRLEDDGSFKAGMSDVFGMEQYLAAGLLSDEQTRRRLILQHLLSTTDSEDLSLRPRLLAWTDPWSLGLDFGPDRHSIGTALVSMPLALERPQAGTEIAIPPPFVPYRSTVGPDGTAPSALWSHRRRQWEERNAPGLTWLRFQVPGELLPFELTRGRMEIRVSGPVGKLAISAARGGQVVPVRTWMDPIGTLTLDIDDPALLGLGSGGDLLLGVAGGDPDRPELTATTHATGTQASYWRIESLTLALWGKTVP
jgi:hypothetical protein